MFALPIGLALAGWDSASIVPVGLCLGGHGVVGVWDCRRSGFPSVASVFLNCVINRVQYQPHQMKKADVAKTLGVNLHVGLLSHEPPGESGLPLV